MFNRAWVLVTDLYEGRVVTVRDLAEQYGMTLRGGRCLYNQLARMLPVEKARFVYGIKLPKQNIGKTTKVIAESEFERAVDIVARLISGETMTSVYICELYGVSRTRAWQLMREMFAELPVQREELAGDYRERMIIRWRKRDPERFLHYLCRTDIDFLRIGNTKSLCN